jgi:hypothetical protein
MEKIGIVESMLLDGCLEHVQELLVLGRGVQWRVPTRDTTQRQAVESDGYPVPHGSLPFVLVREIGTKKRHDTFVIRWPAMSHGFFAIG